jgi:hypothetical protein
VQFRKLIHVVGHSLLLGAVALPLGVCAQQQPADTDPIGWREANGLVGQFQRGHADVWKWEQSNPGVAAAPVAGGATEASGADKLSLVTAEDAVRLAWSAHPDLRTALSQLGTAHAGHVANGQWDAINPELARQVHDFGELLEVAALARKAWVDAVAAGQTERQLRAALEAAEAANTLGARMVAVGNWSRLQHTQTQLAQARSHIALQRAQYAAAQAQARLVKAVQRTGMQRSVELPAQLGPLPAQPLEAAVYQERLARVVALQPRANAMQHQSQAALGFAAYQASYAIARTSRDDVLRLATFVTDETLLHYNGMLKSTWDLLGAAQSQSQAAVDAIAAQRDFETAQIDLQWLLLGGMPASLLNLGAGSADSAGPAGH